MSHVMTLSILPVVGQLLLAAPASAGAAAPLPSDDELCFSANSGGGEVCLSVTVEEGGIELCLYDAVTRLETCLYRPDDAPVDALPLIEPDRNPVDA